MWDNTESKDNLHRKIVLSTLLSPRVKLKPRNFPRPQAVKGRSMTADEYFEQVHEGHQLSKVWYPAW